MKVIGPEYARDSIIKLADNLNADYEFINIRVFPNKEVLARIEKIDALKDHDKIIVFFPTYPNTNDRLILLLETLEILKGYELDASIHLIIPYFPYSRQDKRFLNGEALSLKLILDLLKYLGVYHLYIFDIHNIESFKKYTEVPYTHISLTDYLLKTIYSIHDLENKRTILVAPDEGRLNVVSKLSAKHGLDYTYLIKRRDLYTGEVRIESPAIKLSQYEYAIILDDEISTGGTMSLAAKYLKKSGVKKVIAAASHLLLVGNADKRMFNSGVDYLYGSNTVANPYEIISIEDIVSDYINLKG